MDIQPAPPARRCNADYRWTVPKVRAFLQALAGCGEVAEAARAVGMSRQSAYRLRTRLAGGPWGQGFELARAAGIAAARARRLRAAVVASRWDGPGLAVLTQGYAQGDVARGQGDAGAPQGDVPGAKVTDGGPR